MNVLVGFQLRLTKGNLTVSSLSEKKFLDIPKMNPSLMGKIIGMSV